MASVSAMGISVFPFRIRLGPFTFLLLLAFLFYPNLCVGWQGKVVGISDGDTITVLNEKTPIKVRLCGIDCPEKKPAFWTRAKQVTSDLAFGKVVDVGTADTDRYGRTVGIVRLEDGQSLNEKIIRAGFAWVCHTYCKRPVCLEWKREEDESRATQEDLWTDKNPMPPWEWRAQQRKTG